MASQSNDSTRDRLLRGAALVTTLVLIKAGVFTPVTNAIKKALGFGDQSKEQDDAEFFQKESKETDINRTSAGAEEIRAPFTPVGPKVSIQR